MEAIHDLQSVCDRRICGCRRIAEAQGDIIFGSRSINATLSRLRHWGREQEKKCERERERGVRHEVADAADGVALGQMIGMSLGLQRSACSSRNTQRDKDKERQREREIR